MRTELIKGAAALAEALGAINARQERPEVCLSEKDWSAVIYSCPAGLLRLGDDGRMEIVIAGIRFRHA